VKYVRRVLLYLLPYKGLAALTIAAIGLNVVGALAEPWPLKIIIDYILSDHVLPEPFHHWFGWLENSKGHFLLLLLGIALAINLLDNAFEVLSSYWNTKLEQKVILDFRSDLFQHVQRLSLAYHERKRSGLLIYAVNYQADAAARVIMTIPPLGRSVLTLIGMIYVTYLINAQLALVALGVVPFLYSTINYYARYVQPRLGKVMGLEAESLSIIHEAFSMFKVILAFGRERHEYKRFREQGERAINARIKITVRQTAFTLVVNMITATGTIVVMGFGTFQVLKGRLTAGDLLVVLAYIAAVYNPLNTISYTVGSLQDSFVALSFAYGILDTEPQIKDAPGAEPITKCEGGVRFDHVSFHYPEREQTLKAIDFEAKPGQVVAIVGPTGAGKSTLVSLIPRFYDPDEGRVLIDGKDIRDLTIASVREQISLVLQEPLLFSGSIAQNINYGRLEASIDEVMEAARAANAHDFIVKLPEGYNTELGERGAKLSGGERQRIAVARAFLKNAPILILDEPTSSIDVKTEEVILDALDRLMIGRTTFMIAHRLSTVRHADVILVMNEGELIERGSHDELVALGGFYSQMQDIQIRTRHRLTEILPNLGEGDASDAIAAIEQS
jgi:ABC-type multidrug transport system fused ATPase/permease subunit